MSTLAYVQADMVKKPYLLKEIDGKRVIEHTINGLLEIKEIDEIVMCLHNNPHNFALNYLPDKYLSLSIHYSKEQNAGKRMLEVLKDKNPTTIIRVTGDQIMLDIGETKKMMDIFNDNTFDIYYHDLNHGLLPEILTVPALEKCTIPIGKYHGFLKYINENPHNLSIKKREHASQTPYYRFFIRNDREFHIASEIITQKLDYQRLNIYSELLFEDTGLYEEGWFQSFISKEAKNSKGDSIPWMTYSSIDFLTPRVSTDMSVFEFGCGAGTLWWSNRVAKVTSCEHNEAWVKEVIKSKPNNVKVIYVDLSKEDNYAKQVEASGEQYHIIVIDSRDRINCAKSAVKALRHDGVIIWDDSQRESDNEGKEFILSQGFRKLEFTGMGPIVKDKNETTIFYRDGNCLGI